MGINNPPTNFTPISPGLVPASGGGILNFLRADGNWTPPATNTVTYATLAAMRVGPPAAGITLAQLLNRAVAYDGGMGVFTWLTNAPVQPVDDDCVVIIPAGAPANAAWVRQFSGPVNALWAGASPALVDNAAAFLNADRAALNKVLTNGIPTGEAATVFLPGSGIYKVIAQCTFFARWTGLASEGTVIDNRPTINNNGAGALNFNSDIAYLVLGGLANAFASTNCRGRVRSCKFNSVSLNPPNMNIYGTRIESCDIFSSIQLNPLAVFTPINFTDCLIATNNIDINTATAIFNGCRFTAYAINNFAGISGAVFIKNCTLDTATAVPLGGLVNGVKYIDVDGLINSAPQAANANPLLQASLSISYRNILNFAPSQILASAATNVSPSQTALVAPVNGAIVQNTSPFTKRLVVPVTYNPTAVASATLTVALGPTNAPPVIDINSQPAALTPGEVLSYTLWVPPGWYYSFTVVNAALGNGNLIQ